ncbi:pre-toxin TG domain-containing protein, partial [Aestuariibaculum sediminum]
NLPTSVTLSGGNISYIYDATGVKLSKTVSGTTTYYAGNYVYEGSSLKFFNHPEGYVDAENGYKYVYQYKDHLGNVRLSYMDSNNNGSVNSSEILEENNYYPFGLKHKGYNGNIVSHHPFKDYQGQELTEDLGLNVHEWKYRWSDPSIGRFWQVDPLAADYPHNGTYNFSENRVIDGWELEGLEFYPMNSPFYGRSTLPSEEQSKEALSISTDFTPVVGDVKGVIEAFTGSDLITGDDLSMGGRLLGLVFMSELRGVGKGADAISDTAKAVDKASEIGKDVSKLSDDVPVVRGGSNTPDRFDGGSGVFSRLSDKSLDGISVNSKANKSIDALSVGIPHNKIGVTTVGDVRKAGGDVISSPTKNNPNHATMSIPNSKVASELMEIIKNPNK